MIAKVVPIRRLPKSLEIFDYKVPKEIEEKIQTGQMVRVPFQKSKIFGLIFSYSDQPNPDVNMEKVKPIDSLVQQERFLSEPRLNWLKNISDQYNLSFAAQLKSSLLPLQKRKLKKIFLEKVNLEDEGSIKKPKYRIYTSEEEHKKIIKNNKKTLIITPETRFQQELKEMISNDRKTLIWNSELSQKEQFSKWLKVRNNEPDVIIGTRSSVFLPFQNLNQIIVDHEHGENHKHWDQTPRFHVHDIARQLQKLHSSSLLFTSYSPSCESYFNIYKENFDTEPKTKERISNLNINKKPEIINMKNERKAGNYDIFAEKVKQTLTKTGDDVFVFINRLGYATSIGCQDCEFLAECNSCGLPMVYHKKTKTLHCHYCHTQERIPRNCPKCETKVVELRGTGTEMVEDKIKEIVDNPEIVTRIDSNVENLELNKDQNIIVGTEMAFNHIRWNQTESFIFVNIDKQLRLPDYKASENVWHRIQEVQFYRDKNSDFLIQTMNPKQVVIKSIKEPDRFYRTDLNSRKNLKYPPYKYLVRYFHGAKDFAECKSKIEDVYSKLSKKLTNAKKANIIISKPIEMHPKYYRGKFWFTILVKLNPKKYQQDLIWLNQFIPDDWKVDPNPISILSP